MACIKINKRMYTNYQILKIKKSNPILLKGHQTILTTYKTL
jgi:hypothetical protein